jgi:malonate transporter and related proteins
VAGVLSLCLPIFAVIGLGWLATRARLAPPVMVEAVGAFSFHFALPALLLRLMAAQPLGSSFDPRFFAGYLGACLTVLFAAMGAAALLGGRARAPAAGLGVAAAFGNVGYLGPPLLLSLMGDRASGPLAMAIMAEVIMVLMLGDVMMAARRGDDDAAAAAAAGPLRRALRVLAVNPVILAIAAGAALGATGTALPDPADRFLAFLGGAAGPTALFALGGTLGRLRFHRRLLAIAAAVSAAKLGLYPLLAWAVLGRGLGLDPPWVAAGTLLAAMPIASNAFILAQRHAAAQEEVSAAVLLSTIAAVAAFPLTAWLVAT